METVHVYIPEPHVGQDRMLRHKASRKVVQCGRRTGKSFCGIIRTCEVSLSEEKSPIGWFVPDYKRLTKVWIELVGTDGSGGILGPMVKSANKSEKLITLHNGSMIEFWSLDSPKDTGRSAGYRLVIVDEAGMIPDLETLYNKIIRLCLLDYGSKSECWFLGTPQGRGFNKLYAHAASGIDPNWAAFRLKTTDNPFLPGIKKEAEAAKAQAIATDTLWLYEQEWEGVPHESESGFFGERLINRLIETMVRPYEWRGDIVVPWELRAEWDVMIEKRTDAHFKMDDDENGKLRLWRRPDKISGRPIGIGVDLARGLGASNTVLSIGDCWTREKFGEWASPSVDPRDAARVACSLGVWFGGARINFEANGPGEEFARHLVKVRYGNVYKRIKLPKDSMASGSYDATGWWDDHESKMAGMTMYRSDLAQGRFTNPSREAMLECLLFHRDNNGMRVVHDRDIMEIIDDEASMNHGDRPIADMLLDMVFNETPPPVGEMVEPPVGSAAWDIRKAETAEKARKGWDEEEEQW